jgi:hypothetical protein
MINNNILLKKNYECQFILAESRVARGVSTHELLVSAVDLLEGPALIWYRSVHSTVQSWEIVCPVDSARIFAV